MDKRQQLITTAFELFYHDGVHATGINSVLAESGIAKKTLYNYFSSKDELITATIEYRDALFYNWLKNRMEDKEHGINALYELFSALNDWFNNKDESISSFHGCYFINVAAEFDDINNPIHQQCAQHKQKILDLITYHVSLCCTDPSEALTISSIINMLKDGAITQAYVLGDLQSAEKAKLLLKKLF